MSGRPHHPDPNKCWCTKELDEFVQEVLDIPADFVESDEYFMQVMERDHGWSADDANDSRTSYSGDD